MFVRTRTAEDQQNRSAGWVFSVGCVALFAWQVWAGTSPMWAAVFVLVTFGGTLVLTRIVAETGVPFVRSYFGPANFLSYFPARLADASSIYLGNFLDFILTRASRVSAAVVVLHGLGLNREVKPNRQVRLGLLFLWALVPVILIFLGGNPAEVGHITILPG